jgi:hypothetical protein
MYLAVDAQALQVGDVRGRGIGRYTSHLIRALADASGWRIEAVVNAALAMPDPAALGRVAVRTFEPLLPIDPSTRDANERYFGDWLSALGADAVLEPNVFEGEGLVPRFARPRPLVAGVVYDLIPLIFQERYLSVSLRQWICFWRSPSARAPTSFGSCGGHRRGWRPFGAGPIAGQLRRRPGTRRRR